MSADTRTDPPTEFTWLAERGQSMKQVPTVWWTGDPDDSEYGWTTDATRAMRFSTRESATAYIEARSPIPGNRDRWATAVEHGFIARTDPQSTIPVEPLSDGDKLRVLAAWFDMWDRPETDRQAILDDPRNPGRNDVQRDLVRIAATLDAARASQPITATALYRVVGSVVTDARVAELMRAAAIPLHGHPIQNEAGYVAALIRADLVDGVNKVLATLPVREDEPTGIDVERLATAIAAYNERRASEHHAQRGPHDRNYWVPSLATDDARDIAAEYDRLTREASHVR